MAAKYKRAGIGNWSADASWSTTSGGAADTTAPTAADDVFLDANSGTCTINTTASCRSINCTGFTADLEHTSGITLNIGDGTAGASNIALKFVAGMTYTLGNNTTSAISFISTSATVQTVDFASKSTGPITFNASSNGSWQFTGGHNTLSPDQPVTFTKGTLDINGQTCSWGQFSSSGSLTRTLTLGAAAITIKSGYTSAWDMNNTTGLTITANTAVITFTGSGGGIRATNISLNGSSIVATSSSFVVNGLSGTTTVNNFTRTGTSGKTDTLGLACALTCTGTFTCNGNSATNRVLVQSNTVGTARTITAATVSVTNSDFQDITGAGAGSWDLSAVTGKSGDCGGNSGITFTTSAEQTWNGTSGGNWSANSWTSRVPLPQDDVVINAAFSASQTVTADMPRLGRSINWTGASGSPTWAFSSTSNSIFGGITLISGMSISGTQNLAFAGRSSYTITSAGKTFFNGQVQLIAPSGTYTFADAFSTSSILIWQAGNLVDNGFDVTILRLSMSGTLAKTLASTSANWILTVNTGVSLWNIPSAANLSITGNPNIIVASASTSTRTFDSGINLTYGTLIGAGDSSAGEIHVTGSNSFAKITSMRAIKFTAGATTTIRDANGLPSGNATNKTVISSLSAGNPATLNLSGKQFIQNNISLQDITVTNGVLWAGRNSINVSGNGGNIKWMSPGNSGALKAVRII